MSVTDTGSRKDPRAAGLAALAGLVADETRAACLLALLDGRAWTAGELARHAGVAASTLSEHLGKLVAGGLLAEERQGRHRYVRLAGTRVAQLLEDLAAQVTPDPAHRPHGLRAASAGSAMARGRTCYDHLAGRLGIAVTDALTARRLLAPAPAPPSAAGRPRTSASAETGGDPAPGERGTGFALTTAGVRWFEDCGIVLDLATRRPLARACLDWTERRPHLAGAAGAALCRHALDAGWCVRIGSERAVKVTARGERALADLLGVEPGALR
ncbi:MULTISPECIES: helix-turn-helix transcriptional regulator [unclassified Streptomyces]|uniref:ArsR/SmtB family transcription factor n=1 Tax=unclassified Streptomyces TaxID=2593676 RepID=UPI00070E925B|nr:MULTISPECIES: winged helix-turn-helix domain-containing protein [unclassified Streptomyces]KRD16248.1 ArsR family transcriptional regulator [Streptomyces sp. Root264]